jgi:hypothetical protein
VIVKLGRGEPSLWDTRLPGNDLPYNVALEQVGQIRVEDFPIIHRPGLALNKEDLEVPDA